MMKILYAGGEIAPFAATGGLGDVLGALPAALKSLYGEYDIRAVMPLYSCIKSEYREKFVFEKWIMVPVAWRRQYCGIFSYKAKGVTYYFIDNEYYFNRDRLYGCYDDGERFAFFSEAVLALMDAVGFYPDILHLNDWQTAMSAVRIGTSPYAAEKYKGIKTVFTIHNIDYQGIFGREILGDVFALSHAQFSTVEYDGCINLVKGAVVCADAVTTVSPTYAREICTEFYSHGLYNITRMYSDKIHGIINGIDTGLYNPETDPDIPAVYSAADTRGKAVDKEALQKSFGLEIRPDVPIVAMISRLAEHKGFDLVKRVADELLSRDTQFVLLGTGDSDTEDFFRGLAYRHPGKAAAAITFNRPLSRLIYSGADIFLMPSKSEACGLSQMIASRYGTVPVVRETGGLYDTIKPYTGDSGNGFTFRDYNAHDMLYVIKEAIALYNDKEKWNELVARVMSVDFSWDNPARGYSELYSKLTK